MHDLRRLMGYVQDASDTAVTLSQKQPGRGQVKILHLTLKREWFDMVASGEKKEEYRSPGKWIYARLENKDGSNRRYDRVRFRNGYSPDSPVVDCEYKGWCLGYGKRKWGYGSEPGKPLVVIKLGNTIPAPGHHRRHEGDQMRNPYEGVITVARRALKKLNKPRAGMSREHQIAVSGQRTAWNRVIDYCNRKMKETK